MAKYKVELKSCGNPDRWAGGKVWTEDDQYIGHISYNGRFWEGETA